MKYHVYLDNEVVPSIITENLMQANAIWESYAKQKHRAMLVDKNGLVLKNTSTDDEINEDRLEQHQIQNLMEKIYGSVSQLAEE